MLWPVKKLRSPSFVYLTICQIWPTEIDQNRFYSIDFGHNDYATIKIYNSLTAVIYGSHIAVTCANWHSTSNIVLFHLQSFYWQRVVLSWNWLFFEESAEVLLYPILLCLTTPYGYKPTVIN